MQAAVCTAEDLSQGILCAALQHDIDKYAHENACIALQAALIL